MREDIALLVLVASVVLPGPRKQRLIVSLLAVALIAGSSWVGGPNWFVETGLIYVGAAANPLAAVVREVWDGGALVVQLILVALPGFVLGRIGWRTTTMVGVFVAPLLVLDVAILDGFRNHYFAPAAFVIAPAVAVQPRSLNLTRSWIAVLAVLMIAVSRFGLSSPADRLPATAILSQAANNHAGLAEVHRWLDSQQLDGRSVSVDPFLQPHIWQSDEVYMWPTPFTDAYLPGLSDLPLVGASDAVPDVVIAPTGHCQTLAPRAAEIDVGFDHELVDLSPGGCFGTWLIRVTP
jgi:hypothetical protein